MSFQFPRGPTLREPPRPLSAPTTRAIALFRSVCFVALLLSLSLSLHVSLSRHSLSSAAEVSVVHLFQISDISKTHLAHDPTHVV